MKTSPIKPLFFLLLLCLSACEKSHFTTADGVPGRFDQGKWVLINYWATWCGPCREEIPDLNEFADNNSDIQIYGINYDGLEGESLSEAITEMGINFPSLSNDPAPELGVARPQVLPTTFLLDPKGELVATLTGPQTIDSLKAAINKATTTD
jgi:thiol-disulfide isomerase/thioredoxin